VGVPPPRAAEAKAEAVPALVDRLAAEGKLEHTAPRLGSSARVAAVWLGVWVLPLAGIWLWRGGADVLSQQAIFFSQAAVVTFGGAYAVLAWVAQQAVGHFGWLSPAQMVDGLGLAETTPGPLILVLEFVGFVAAFQGPGDLHPLAAGALGAAISVWATFAPCFLWIFAFAPWVEAVRGNRRLAGALAAITAAVVGVILNLSVFFALHVLFGTVGSFSAGPMRVPVPAWSTLDWRAALISTLAVAMLFAFKQNLGRTLALCALLGAALKGLT
jgi:chromate transporter